MQVAYDGHIFRWPTTGGISRYFWEIISNLPADWNPVLVGVEKKLPSFPSHPLLDWSTMSTIKPRRWTQPLKRHYWRKAVLQKAKVFHPTYYSLTGGMNYSDIKCPVVVTVHDFIQARYPKLESQSQATIAAQRESIERADHLVCVSRATERDLLEFFPQASGKTSVIYHGSSFQSDPPADSDRLFDPPTFLFVGRRSTYKNFRMLLRAFAKAATSHPTVRLHVAGPALDDEERWQAHLLGISDRIDSTIYPDESDLKLLYRSSVALLYPSLHEGFGIPPLEAMACGTLAVSSNSTSLPEVVGDGGIMLDPSDEAAWTECILQVANNQVNRELILERARKRVALFSWKQSTEQHVAIYRSHAG